MDPRPRALVVGGGVSGLSTGLLLLERGFDVELRSREPALASTSGVAAAVWYPYKVGPPERAAAWARASYARFAELAQVPSSGVVLRPGLELLPGPGHEEPWRSELADLRAARAEELPEGYPEGYVFRVPVIEMPIYLDWLEGRLLAAGGRVERAEVGSLEELAREADLAVDCAGLGARELAGDDTLVPVRGQVLRVENPGVERVTLDDHNPAGVTYVVPRSSDCVLGGTADEGATSMEADATETEAILARCRALEPRLAHAAVREVAVGLRPWRPGVRIELEELGAGRRVLHNYGHGGAGVTISWGCALDAARLAAAAFPGLAPAAPVPPTSPASNGA